MVRKKEHIETEEEKKGREMIEEIAQNISSLSKSVKTLLGGRLKEKALIILLTHSSGCAQYQVKNLLTALENLEKDWTN